MQTVNIFLDGQLKKVSKNFVELKSFVLTTQKNQPKGGKLLLVIRVKRRTKRRTVSTRIIT